MVERHSLRPPARVLLIDGQHQANHSRRRRGKALSLVDEASALRIEAIEKFIGQKIPVKWPEDELFVAEVMPTAEERRRYADERPA